MWERCPCTALPVPPHFWLGGHLLGLSLSSACQCFWIVWWFRVVDKSPVFAWTKTPIHFALSPGFIYNLPLQRQKAYELTFPTTLSPRHLFRLWLENPMPSQVWTQALVMTNAQQHPELLRLSWSENMGLTQLDGGSGNKGTIVWGGEGLRGRSLGIARWVKKQEKWTFSSMT